MKSKGVILVLIGLLLLAAAGYFLFLQKGGVSFLSPGSQSGEVEPAQPTIQPSPMPSPTIAPTKVPPKTAPKKAVPTSPPVSEEEGEEEIVGEEIIE